MEPLVDKSGRNAARGALLAPLLLLGPLVIALDRLDVAGELTLFVLAGLALIPLSWLIGEATDNLALHTGPGIGGFLNATFGNAPELIIAIVAIADGLTEIVRASLVGSVAGNLLLVLGFTLLFGRKGAIDRQSAYVSLGLVGFATVLVLVAAVPGFHGNPDRRSLAELSLPIAALLLIVRVTVTRRALRRQRQLQASAEVEDGGWPLPAALVVLGLATVVTALLTETLVGTLRAFAQTAHLSEFFVAVVIVAIVGNATEHGSAVLLARRGRVKLAVEIPLASSAQIAGLLIPLVALVSWFFEPLALSFRPIELAALGIAAVLPALVLRLEGDGHIPLHGDTHALNRQTALLVHLGLVRAHDDCGIDERSDLVIVHLEDEEAPENPHLRRRQSEAVRLDHEPFHPLDQPLEIRVEVLNLRRRQAQDGIRVLADLRERGEATRLLLGITLPFTYLAGVGHRRKFRQRAARLERSPASRPPALSGRGGSRPTTSRRPTRTRPAWPNLMRRSG